MCGCSGPKKAETPTVVITPVTFLGEELLLREVTGHSSADLMFPDELDTDGNPTSTYRGGSAYVDSDGQVWRNHRVIATRDDIERRVN